METVFTVFLVFLMYTCWLWPILFVFNLLDCIKGIVQQKEEREYRKNVLIAIFSLFCMSVSPFVISMLAAA